MARERVKDEMEGWESGDEGGVKLEMAEEENLRSTAGPWKDGEKRFYTAGGAVLDV